MKNKQNDLTALQSEQLINLSEYGLRYLGDIPIRDSKDIVKSRIGVGFETLDRQMFDPEKVYPHLAKLGAKFARVQTGWSRCETSKGVYDFTWLEEIVDQLIEVGVEPLFSLSFGNTLYCTDAEHESAVGYVPLYYGEEATQAWRNYLTALAETFKGRVRSWEVWNEPNISQFWYPKEPDPTAYAELVRISAKAVRSGHPSARIIGGAMSKLDSHFLEAILQCGIAKHIDAFSFHPYQLVPEDNMLNMHAVIRRLLDKYSDGKDIEIWQGENGCPSQTEGHNDDWLGLYDTDQVVQAKWVVRRILCDLKNDYDMALYFHAVDLMARPYRQSDGKERKPVMMGLVHGDSYEPKYSFEAMQRVCTLFDSDSHVEELYCQFLEPNPARPSLCGRMGGPMSASFTRKGVPLVALWLTEDPQQKRPAEEIDLVFWCDSNLKFDEPVLADIMTGRIYDVAPLLSPFVPGRKDVGLRCRIPLPDYPLILTDRSVFDEFGGMVDSQ
ncbi:hypothetical protein SH580_12675 [Coraliomargarita algicola]|uniref:Glycosyl hydrolases family 39 N-terminal catalytic domain-containing protein n=1 Tax=Coraliomargarita algicola TaxID=3092156 RepID=A0ABZ0RDQ3_9BACT|nr:hypothetical protein [Coraliomargarita sp. J2-16]WPJ94290.1 hypothetical protein SH580_12675 [Coraliomargarita sp. J2-16]